MSFNVAGQTIPVPDMQGLKNIVSVKSKDRLSSRLPPLRGIPNRPVDGGSHSTLPPIGASPTAGQHPLPSISATFTTSQTTNKPEQHDHQVSNGHKADPGSPGASNGRGNDLSVNSHATENHHRASINDNQQNELAESHRYRTPHQPREAANNRMLGLQSTPQSTMFQTTDRRHDEMPSHEMAAQVLNREDQETVEHLEERGLRTWPVIAVFSVFFCNPLLGMIAAMLTLKAENSYYHGNLLEAQRESRIAKFFLILAVVSGCIMFVSIVIWVCVRCANFDCPTPR